ncbi:MAG: hypothetical protein CXZ00_15735 [Acidobacteria bacterium]|nr:MAG: hypothetical protein CXZ00_15735 [Acidobacteriota bacterium]
MSPATLQQASDFLGISARTFRRWRKEVPIPSVKAGRRILVELDDLEPMITLRKQARVNQPEGDHVVEGAPSAELQSTSHKQPTQLNLQPQTVTLPANTGDGQRDLGFNWRLF